MKRLIFTVDLSTVRNIAELTRLFDEAVLMLNPRLQPSGEIPVRGARFEKIGAIEVQEVQP